MIVKRFVLSVALGLMAVTAFAWLNGALMLAEFVVSFRPHLLAGTALWLLVSLLFGSQSSRIIMLLVVGVNLWPLLPYYVPQDAAPQHNLSLLLYNADKNRLPYVGVGEVVDLVESAETDVVVLLEIGEEQSAALQAALADRFTHHIAHQDAAHDGVLIFSRVPVAASEVLAIGPGRKTVVADLTVDGAPLHLVVPHPTNAWYGFDERNAQLAALGTYVADGPQPLVVAGDLNVTMWSRWYAQLGLRNVREGRGVMASWRVPLGALPLPFMRLPLDHVLVGNGVGVFSAELLPSPGSDHQPLFVQLFIE